MFDVANHVFATVAGHLQPNVTKQRHRYYYLFYFILFFFDPGTQFPGNEKNYAMQYKKVQKSSWNKTYSSSSFTKQSCSKMAPAPSVQHRKEK